MATKETNFVSPAEVFGLLVRHPLRWLVPALLVAALATTYAFTKTDRWEATQGLIVRNEASGAAVGPGKFGQADEMKTVLETILELSRSSGVLSEALKTVGPPSGRTTLGWPTAQDLDDLSGSIKLTPPKGAEYGKTEVFYLQVQDTDRNRALALAKAISDELEARYNRLRDTRAESMVGELTATHELAQADLKQVTGQLSRIEASVGRDLSELRALHQPGIDSDLRRRTLELDNELRQARRTARSHEELLGVLVEARKDPGHLLAAPQGLLESQPILRRLKDGLVDAQLRTAQLLGRMTENHPHVVASRASEIQISQDLHRELETAVRGVEVDQRLAQERVAELETQVATTGDRLTKIASLRAEYSNLVAEVDRRSRLVEQSERELADARGRQASARTASLIDRIDVADAGTRPIGPGKKIIILGGAVGGLVFGLGLLLVTLQPASSLPPAPVSAPSPFEAQVHGLSLKQAFRKVAARSNAA